jgi:histone H3/H4
MACQKQKQPVHRPVKEKKPDATPSEVRKSHRYKPDSKYKTKLTICFLTTNLGIYANFHFNLAVALREILKLQKSQRLICAKTAFRRVMREITKEYCTDLRMQKKTVECLQKTAKAYLINLFQDTYTYIFLKYILYEDI